ncbi:hypothetical protein ACRALDRAFT_208525 [Sodiomyces alcalophilus JCM 7366]|uniref:uncharacterized protein n=1 Tax=Sodiomyces alcalophilus JCM 7366 TaxID=591952 RepID=UPI0039B4F6A0
MDGRIPLLTTGEVYGGSLSKYISIREDGGEMSLVASWDGNSAFRVQGDDQEQAHLSPSHDLLVLLPIASASVRASGRTAYLRFYTGTSTIILTSLADITSYTSLYQYYVC